MYLFSKTAKCSFACHGKGSLFLLIIFNPVRRNGRGKLLNAKKRLNYFCSAYHKLIGEIIYKYFSVIGQNQTRRK